MTTQPTSADKGLGVMDALRIVAAINTANLQHASLGALVTQLNLMFRHDIGIWQFVLESSGRVNISINAIGENEHGIERT